MISNAHSVFAASLSASKSSDLWVSRSGMMQGKRRPEHHEIFGIGYISRPTRPLTVVEIAEIEKISTHRNAKFDISGVLIIDPNWILQMLEGPYVALSRLVDKIAQDPRHTDFRIFTQGVLPKKTLPKWEMSVRCLKAHSRPESSSRDPDAFSRLAEILWKVPEPLTIAPQRFTNIHRLAHLYRAA